MKSVTNNYSIYLFLLILSFGCKKDEAKDPNIADYEVGEDLPGGDQTGGNHSENAFSFAMPGLYGVDALNFFVGDSFFNQNWVAAPASTTARDGLGPTFNSRSCTGCHPKDGRGRAPEFDGEKSTGLLLRLSQSGVDIHGGPLPLADYGGQLNDLGIFGISAEGDIQITYFEESGSFPDGETYSLRKPVYSIANPNYGALPSDLMISPRVGQQMIGLGLLEAISDQDLLKNVDESDANNDGVSGRANYVWDFELGSTVLGKFGWKANMPNLKQQTAGAFIGDIGITSSLFPQENCPSGQIDCSQQATGGSPELEDEDLDFVTLYVSTLAVPSRLNAKNEEVLRGKKLFNGIGCVKCHVPSYTTGAHSRFSGLSYQKIWPYTDLLLHDMGAGLADNRPDYLANGNEWRTPPLWGIGLFETVNNHTYYLHDGRARNIQEAILWHGGEANNSKEAFKALTKQDRTYLIQFLNSL